MNDALDHGEHMRDETVTMSRDEYEAALKYARVHAVRVAAIKFRDEMPLATDVIEFYPEPFERMIAAVENYADELEGEG